jgi:peptidoglycan/LPS O-acetylase OafA/YrhL
MAGSCLGKQYQNNNHLFEIDLLRVIGAVSVVLYHYTFRNSINDGSRSPMFPIIEIVTRYGYLGVNLFFMISGFVILFSALKKTPLDFVLSRMDRLYPAYWVSVSLTSAIVLLFSGSIISIYQYLMNLTMINDHLNIPSIDGIYWTLHVELKFYFLIFLLILMKQINKYHIWIPIWLGLAVIYETLGRPFIIGKIIIPYYSSYLLSGILFYIIYMSGLNWERLSMLAVSYILSVYTSIGQAGGFIYAATIVDKILAPLLVTVIYIVFFVIATRRVAIKRSAFLTIVGGMTYPLYLLHTRIGHTIYDCFSRYMNKYITLIIVLFIIIQLSYAVYALAEKNAGKLKKSLMTAFPSGLFRFV